MLGGSHDEGDWNTDVCQETKARIFRDCCKILPSLRVSEWGSCAVADPGFRGVGGGRQLQPKSWPIFSKKDCIKM